MMCLVLNKPSCFSYARPAQSAFGLDKSDNQPCSHTAVVLTKDTGVIQEWRWCSG